VYNVVMVYLSVTIAGIGVVLFISSLVLLMISGGENSKTVLAFKLIGVGVLLMVVGAGLRFTTL